MRRVVVAAAVGAIVTTIACKGPASVEAKADVDVDVDANANAKLDAQVDADADARVRVRVVERKIGPFEVPLEGSRKVYYVAPKEKKNGRLIANLHGVCNPPGYACGYWVEAASKVGFLVCPEGNAHCGGPQGAPTWSEPIAKMDADLEKSIAIVDGNHPGEMSREGAILTGFSLGATVAAQIARMHPGRWPYLVLVEADVQLDMAQLRAAGVRAVALLAGEIGSQVAGERRTAERLAKQGFPAKLWVMKGAGHHYSGDIDTIMAEAIAFVLSAGESDGGATARAAADAGR